MTPAVPSPRPAAQPDADYSLRRYLAEAFEVVTNADSRLLRTCRALLTRPGVLTAAYFSPARDEYLRPQQVLLLSSVFFFFVQPLIGFNGLNSPLSIHLSQTPYSPLVAPWIMAEAARHGGGLEAYRAVFDAAVDAHARTLAFLLVPIFALLAMLVSWRRYFVQHLVFATHFVAFLLLVLTPAVMALSALARLAYRAGLGVDAAYAIGDSFGPALLCAVYLAAALRTAYGEGPVPAAVKGVVLSLGMLPVLTAYRFILFLATYYGL